MTKIQKLKLIAIVLGIFLPVLASASTTDGTVSSSANDKARFENTSYGYINFGATNGNVHITDSALTGYAWGETVGWINLAPTGSGVVNSSGTLSGYAWGEVTGWINFAPTNGGVTINSSGDFSGYAWSQNLGWIIFNCSTDNSCLATNYKVNTDWRPPANRIACNDSADNDSDSKIDYPNDPGCSSAGDNDEADPAGGGGGGGTILPPPPSLPPPPPSLPPPPPKECVGCEVVLPPPPPPPPCTDCGITSPGGGEGTGVGAGGASGGGGGGGAIFQDLISQVQDSARFVVETATAVAQNVKAIVNTPTGSVVTKTVATAGAIGGGLVTASALFVNPVSISEIFLLPLRLWGLLLAAFNLKKRRLPWGTVYDSVTKQPLDPAYVVLYDMNGKEIDTSITDLDGRYGFLLSPGTYRIVANKTNYVFPSDRLAGRGKDELYGDLYFGEQLTVDNLGAVITRNIPLDPLKFDWNEFAKKDKGLMNFYSRHDRLIRKITDWLFVFGFVVAVIALFAAPQPYNIGIFALYIVLLLLRVFGLGNKPYGVVKDKNTGLPLSFALVHVFDSGTDIEVMQKVTDQFGRYFLLAPDKTGTYILKFEKKNDDGSYLPVYTSEPIAAKKGIIDREILIG